MSKSRQQRTSLESDGDKPSRRTAPPTGSAIRAVDDKVRCHTAAKFFRDLTSMRQIRPQGLKPSSKWGSRGAEAPLFHGRAGNSTFPSASLRAGSCKKTQDHAPPGQTVHRDIVIRFHPRGTIFSCLSRTPARPHERCNSTFIGRCRESSDFFWPSLGMQKLGYVPSPGFLSRLFSLAKFSQNYISPMITPFA
jgi:hypothetical protein